LKKLFFVNFLLLATNILFSQICEPIDKQIFSEKMKYAYDAGLMKAPLAKIITEIGKSFIGTDYVAHTLEGDGEENLIVRFNGLDCTTFLETTLALARCIHSRDTSFNNYCNELTTIRYRNGIINKYPSRLHYFSEWIRNNEEKGIVSDRSKELGGVPIVFNLNYMSTHPESYKQLKENPAFIKTVEENEKQINSHEFYYLPKKLVSDIENKIDSGDLIALTTSIEGMDIQHVGIAVKAEDGTTHFLHAPLSGHKVQISELPLSAYLKKVGKCTGILVVRPLSSESDK